MADRHDVAEHTLSIGKGVTITGRVHTEGSLHLNGTIDGEVVAKDIFVGPSGRVNGVIRVENAEVSGTLGDDVTVTGRLALLETAVITGNVVWGLLEVRLGARLNATLSKFEGEATNARATTGMAESQSTQSPLVASTSPEAESDHEFVGKL